MGKPKKRKCEKGFEKMGKKKSKAIAYDPKNLQFLGRSLLSLRKAADEGETNFKVNIDNLEVAVRKLPDIDRLNVEKFWGLTGGPNHSKKLGLGKDIAYIQMRNSAILSMNKLFYLDYMFIYDEHMKILVEQIMPKIDKGDLQISDLEAIKYILMFLIAFQNGPKMSFEEDLMEVDTNCQPEFIFDEYTVLEGAYDEFKNWPEKCINLRLVKDMLDMVDFQDAVSLQKSFGIACSEETRRILGREYETIGTTRSFRAMRALKERIFPFGDWEVTALLIFRDKKDEVTLNEFAKCLDKLSRDWSQIEKFKTGQKKLATSREVRTLDVYNIGGLEFTDIYEVMFLYLERNYIDFQD